MTVSFDSRMALDVEAIASKRGLSAEEYIVKIVAEAIEDAYDYERCVMILEEHDRDPQSQSHDEVMREFGLH